MDPRTLSPAGQLALYMQRIYDAGLTTTSGGNISLRDGADNVWITPASIDKGSLREEDIVCVRPDGTVLGRHRPSSELPFHQSVYRMRPDVRCVLHAHPPALVAFSMTRTLPAPDLLPNLRALCPRAMIAAYAVPGSLLLSKFIGDVFRTGCDLAVLENHGVCVAGRDLPDAFCRFEAFHHAAKLDLLARRLGKARQAEASVPTAPTLRTFAHTAPLSGEAEGRKELAAFVRRAVKTGLFSGAQGCFSRRLGSDAFLITPFGADPAYVEADDLVLVRSGAAQADKMPHPSVRLHRAVYARDGDVQAIALAQPLHAMAFAVTGTPVQTRAIPESYVLLRDIPTLPGWLLCQPEALAARLSHRIPAALVENGFALTTGGSCLQAFDRLEVLEATAQALLDVGSLGPIVEITEKQIANIHIAFKMKE